jgi:acetyl esterase/lipase
MALSADYRLPYGHDPSQFCDLWLPRLSAAGKAVSAHPVIAFLHGGWWQSEYDLAYANPLCSALRDDGCAVWSIEYRRVGSTGGGWPATFQDAAAGFDLLTTAAPSYKLDLNRVVAMGHSAGGHLAFWLAGRHHIAEDSPLRNPQPKFGLHGLVALAGAVDLRLTIDLSGYFTFAHDKREVYSLMGGKPGDLPDRYKAGNPGDLLPLNVRQVLLQGTEDNQIPAELPGRWANNARRLGDEVAVVTIPGADHFDVVQPESKAFESVRGAVKRLFER